MKFLSMLRISALALIPGCGMSAALADEPDGFTVLAPHVHGVARLQAVITAQGVEVDFTAPGINLFGFEHAPQTTQERNQLAQARERLQQGDSLFAFDAAAGCRRQSAKLAEHALADEDEPHHEEAASAEHDEREEHPHHHLDLSAHYRFTCTHPQQVRELRLDVFQVFPTLQKVQVEYVTPTAQGAKDATPAQPRIDLDAS